MYCWLEDEVSVNARPTFYFLTIYRFYIFTSQYLSYSFSSQITYLLSRQTFATSSRQTIANSSRQTIANSSRQTITISTILSMQNTAKIAAGSPVDASTSGSTSSSPNFTQLSKHLSFPLLPVLSLVSSCCQHPCAPICVQ